MGYICITRKLKNLKVVKNNQKINNFMFELHSENRVHEKGVPSNYSSLRNNESHLA